MQGTLFPMCGMNLAFNRDLIGPSMYFGLMGDGQPLGRYDDMWAGWCSKVRAPVAIGAAPDVLAEEGIHVPELKCEAQSHGRNCCWLQNHP